MVILTVSSSFVPDSGQRRMTRGGPIDIGAPLGHRLVTRFRLPFPVSALPESSLHGRIGLGSILRVR